MAVRIKKAKAIEAKGLAVVRERWKPYQRILDLGSVKIDYLRAQLIKGVPPRVVGRVIKEEWGDLPELSLDALADNLKAWRDKNVMPGISASLLESVRLSVPAALAKLDTMNELIDLCLLQKKRMHKMYAKEAEGPLLMATVSNEVTSLAGMLRDLAKLQIETGVLPRAARSVAGTLEVQDPEGASRGKVSFNWTSDMDREFMEVLEHFEVFKDGGHVIEATASDND